MQDDRASPSGTRSPARRGSGAAAGGDRAARSCHRPAVDRTCRCCRRVAQEPPSARRRCGRRRSSSCILCWGAASALWAVDPRLDLVGVAADRGARRVRAGPARRLAQTWTTRRATRSGLRSRSACVIALALLLIEWASGRLFERSFGEMLYGQFSRRTFYTYVFNRATATLALDGVARRICSSSPLRLAVGDGAGRRDAPGRFALRQHGLDRRHVRGARRHGWSCRGRRGPSLSVRRPCLRSPWRCRRWHAAGHAARAARTRRAPSTDLPPLEGSVSVTHRLKIWQFVAERDRRAPDRRLGPERIARVARRQRRDRARRQPPSAASAQRLSADTGSSSARSAQRLSRPWASWRWAGP